MMKPKSVIILTHIEDGKPKLPHLKWLKRSNPDVDIHIVVGKDSPLGKRDNWKNGDRPLRDWWGKHGHEVVGTIVYVLEWDTLVNCELPDLSSPLDLAGGSMVKSPKSKYRPKRKRMNDPNWTESNWFWWPELPKMGLKYGDSAIGLFSFGCLVMKRRVLDNFVDLKWDEIYKKSITSELRFPTIAHLSGLKVGEINLPYVKFYDVEFTGEKEIYHGVNQPQ